MRDLKAIPLFVARRLDVVESGNPSRRCDGDMSTVLNLIVTRAGFQGWPGDYISDVELKLPARKFPRLFTLPTFCGFNFHDHSTNFTINTVAMALQLNALWGQLAEYWPSIYQNAFYAMPYVLAIWGSCKLGDLTYKLFRIFVLAGKSVRHPSPGVGFAEPDP